MSSKKGTGIVEAYVHLADIPTLQKLRDVMSQNTSVAVFASGNPQIGGLVKVCLSLDHYKFETDENNRMTVCRKQPRSLYKFLTTRMKGLFLKKFLNIFSF